MSRERAEAAATRIETEAVAAGFAALAATPRGIPNRVKVLDFITRALALELAVARKMRQAAQK